MNTSKRSLLALSAVFLGFLLLAMPALAKKPSDPGSKPPPSGEEVSCANSGSYFPAFMYVVDDQLFLSNAAGDCTIAIYKSDIVIPWGISFRFFEDDNDPTSGFGRIAWLEWNPRAEDRLQSRQLYWAEFHVDAGALVENLPLTPKPLMSETVGYPERHVSDPSLSSDASLIYVTGPGNTNDQHFIDVFDLETGERSRVFETTVNGEPDVHILGLQPGLEDQRLYFRLWAIDEPDGSVNWTQSLVYIERNNGDWPAIAYDATDQHLSTEPTELITDDYGSSFSSVGYWDYDGDGTFETVLSQSPRVADFREIEILDVENCANGNEPCFVLGTRSEAGIAVAGDQPSFTSLSYGPPNLLYITDSGEAAELDLDTLTSRTLIKGKGKNVVSGLVSAD